MNTRAPAFGITALLVATTAWGGLFVVAQGALRAVDPFWFTAIRYAIAGLAFAALIAPRGAAPWRRLRRDAGALAWRGGLGFGDFSVMVLAGLAHSVPAHGAIIMATMPLTTQLLRWALDGVRPARSAWPITLLALAGVALASGVLLPGGADGEGARTWPGDLLALAGTLGWVAYTRGAARFAELDVLEYTALTVLASWPLLLAAALLATALGLAHVPDAAALQPAWPALLYVGLVASAVAVLAFNHGVRILGGVGATAFLNFVPVSALLAGALLGRPPTAAELGGMALVVAALLLHTAAGARAGARVVAATPPFARPPVLRSNAPCHS